MSPKIEILPYEVTRFRCTITFDKYFALLPHPVQGQKNDSPPRPFVDGFGPTPEDALRAAFYALGQSLVRCMAHGESKLVEMLETP